MYTDYTLQQQQMNGLPFTQGPQDPALLQDYINSQNLQTQDPNLQNKNVAMPQQQMTQPQPQPQQPQAQPGVQLAGPMVPGALPTQAPAPAPQLQPQSQDQPQVQAQSQQQPAPVEQAQPQPVPPHAVTYADIQQDPTALLNYAKNPDVPEHMKTQATVRAGDLLSQNRQKDEAVQKVATMQPTELANALKERTTGGSWTKAIIYGLLGMHNMAQDEAAKLGIGKDTAIVGPDGKPYLIKMAANGTPLEGFDATTGAKLKPHELVAAASGTDYLKGANAGGQLYRDEKGNSLTKIDSLHGPIWYNAAGQRTIPAGQPVPLTAGTDLLTQTKLSEMKRKEQFLGQTANQRLQSFKEYNNERVMSGQQPYTLDQMGLTPTGEVLGQTHPLATGPVTPSPNITQPTQQVAPAVPGSPLPPGLPMGVPAGAPNITPTPGANNPAQMTGSQLAAQRAALKKGESTVAGETAKKVANAGEIADTINNAEHAIDILNSKEHHIGPLMSGAPIAQAVGEQMQTPSARNTKMVMDIVRDLGGTKAQNTIKGHLSNQELSFLTDNKPTERSDPEYTKQWLEKYIKALRAAQEQAQAQVNLGGVAENPALSNKHPPGSKENPIKLD